MKVPTATPDYKALFEQLSILTIAQYEAWLKRNHSEATL